MPVTIFPLLGGHLVMRQLRLILLHAVLLFQTAEGTVHNTSPKRHSHVVHRAVYGCAGHSNYCSQFHVRKLWIQCLFRLALSPGRLIAVAVFNFTPPRLISALLLIILASISFERYCPPLVPRPFLLWSSGVSPLSFQ